MAFVALAGCKRATPDGALQGFDPGPTPDQFRQGEEVFDAHCATCHGSHAVGTDRGPPLVHQIYEPSHHADEAFQRAVTFGVQAHHWNFGSMQPVEGVTREDVTEIIGYVRW
ncbi:MAG: cytochrome c, partial [Gemmatimonadales bacterium]|nr:cytochrome c [Gemmatimonadales bacterium]